MFGPGFGCLGLNALEEEITTLGRGVRHWFGLSAFKGLRRDVKMFCGRSECRDDHQDSLR